MIGTHPLCWGVVAVVGGPVEGDEGHVEDLFGHKDFIHIWETSSRHIFYQQWSVTDTIIIRMIVECQHASLLQPVI